MQRNIVIKGGFLLWQIIFFSVEFGSHSSPGLYNTSALGINFMNRVFILYVYLYLQVSFYAIW